MRVRGGLCRWDSALPPTADNLVLLTFDEADAHDAAELADIRGSEPEWVTYVETLLSRVRWQLGS
jgi:hypothetical protein